ncbi:MAG: type II CAAX endopeptidase family protein [Leptolyngbyaceae bacterium]|nr:type II CAAX endopeptidase family protein [Leptolyngbyaceae bacterium]
MPLLKINLASLAHYPVPLRLIIFVVALLCLWLPLAAPIYGLVRDPNWVSILTLVWLYVAFMLLLRVWGKQVHRQPHIFQHYGLRFSRQNGLNLLKGLSIGFFSLLTMFLLQGWLGWIVWQQPMLSFPRIALEGLLVAIGIGFAEELFFRGWLLDELQRDYSLTLSLWLDSSLFAILHFIKPLSEIIRTLPQFLGLWLLGAILVWAKRQGTELKGAGHGNIRVVTPGLLGLPIGLHAGLVGGYYLINVGQLTRYTNQVPEWVTGVDRNPLAGVLGLVCLGAIALWASRNQPKASHFS